MKITREYLRRIIKEELERTLNEAEGFVSWQQLIDAAKRVGDENLANKFSTAMTTYKQNPDNTLRLVGNVLYHSYSEQVKQPYMEIKNQQLLNAL